MADDFLGGNLVYDFAFPYVFQNNDICPIQMAFVAKGCNVFVFILTCIELKL